MRSSSPDGGAIEIPLPRGSFGIVKGRVTRRLNMFRASNPAEQPRLSVEQDYRLQRVSSHGILGILQRMNVAGSPEMLRELESNADADPFSDLVKVETDHQSRISDLRFKLETLERADAESDFWDEASEAEKRQLQEDIRVQERYTRLAGAVGATARATVAVKAGSNPEAIWGSIDRARSEVGAASDPELDAEQIGSSIGSVAGSALIQMLDQVEAIASARPARAG